MTNQKQTQMNIPKKPIVSLLYNGKNCTKDFSAYLNSISFQDFEDEQSDELVLNLNNNDGYFTDIWYPNKGDKLTCTIQYGSDVFNCGTLAIDDNNFDFSSGGDTVEIRALATSTNFSLRTNKTKNHSGKTLNQIAEPIGKSYGFKVAKETGNIKVGNIIQKNESDIAFLKRIAREYGYIFNIKDNLLTFIQIESLENQKALFSLYKEDLSDIHLNDTTTKLYGKCKVSYLDQKSKSIKTYTAIGNTELTDTLTIHKRCLSLEEAKKVAHAGLKNSKREITGSVKLTNPVNNFMAGINFDIFGISRFEGLYHIKSSKRTINENGYIVSGEIQKCI